jgi:hypothetical protein
LATVALGAATAVEALVVPHSVDMFGPGTWLAGATLAAVSAVSLLGVLAVPAQGDPAALLRTTTLLTVGPGVLAGLLLVLPLPVLATGGFIAAGLLLIPIVPANVLISSRLPAGCRASAFSLLMAGLAVVQVSFGAIAGLLAELTSPHVAAAAVCTVPALVGAWTLTGDRRHPGSVGVAPPAAGSGPA